MALVGVAYLGLILVLVMLENFFLYHPTRASEDWLEPPNSRVRDVELHSADGTMLHAWWCPCEGATGAVLLCHGNAGNLSHRGWCVAGWQQQMDQSVFIVDYPGYGRSAGKPSEAGCYAAADAACDWLVQEQKTPPENIILLGESLGCAVAVDLASRRPCRALVLLSPFTSIPDMAQKQFPFLPARWLVRNRFNNLEKIGKCAQPVFIAHGDADGLVPYSQGQRLFAAAGEPKFFLTMKGCDHNDRPQADLLAQVKRFLEAIHSETSRPLGSEAH
jgi:fermentation-respiration switch protein FrsA (DUF1100 family)